MVRGEEILWVVGPDEKAGKIYNVEYSEFSTWWGKVHGCFDEMLAPVCSQHLPIPLDGDTTIVAMLFETDRAPYVVKNSDGGAITYEVAWRDGERTRSAHRSELLKILSPLQRVPKVEITDGKLQVNVEDGGRRTRFKLDLDLYVIPLDDRGVYLPARHTSASLRIDDALVAVTGIMLNPFRTSGDARKHMAVTEPLAFTLTGSGEIEGTIPQTIIGVRGQFLTAGTDVAVPFETTLAPNPQKNYIWSALV
jgi:hypothetical protein